MQNAQEMMEAMGSDVSDASIQGSQRSHHRVMNTHDERMGEQLDFRTVREIL